VRPDISVLIPARNEQSRLAPTIEAIAGARTTGARVEFVIVDDASTDGTVENLISAVPRLLGYPKIDIRVCRLESQAGIYGARNQAGSLARGDILFMTDAHVRFSRGWDECVLRNVSADRIIAGTTTQDGTDFRGYGCSLLVPMMGTTWNREPADGPAPVHVAPCHATVLTRDLFDRLGGYDPGMIIYGAGEPEFSIRAWLNGAEVINLPGLEVQHRFKPQEEFGQYISSVRPYWVHNCLRFALLYLSEAGCFQVIRHFALTSQFFQVAIRMIDVSDVWERREHIEKQCIRSFYWFVQRFGLCNQAGGVIA
jgi:GT2 family glycosyltransferase